MSADEVEDVADLLDICKDGDFDVPQTSLVSRGFDPCQVHLHSVVSNCEGLVGHDSAMDKQQSACYNNINGCKTSRVPSVSSCCCYRGCLGLLTSGVSVDAAMTSQFKSLNSSERSENAMISVGHTKVKSLG